MISGLEGKKAFVCGSTQGIGHAVAFTLANLGVQVVLVARDRQKLEETLAQLPKPTGVKHDFLCADFSKPEELQQAALHYVKEKGPVHILVNNTGGPPAGPIVSAQPDQFESAFRQHLLCNHVLAGALVPGMITAGYGRIINIISTSVKQPLPNLGVSNTIRAAVANWAKTLANELGRNGITVNNVLPGATSTQRLKGIISGRAGKTGLSEDKVSAEMRQEIPLGRFAEPEEIAFAVAFLASPQAGYITGINLPVDGGRTSSL